MGDETKRNARFLCLFLLGTLLLNYPLISIFNLPRLLFGIPLLYGYIFFVWGLLIVLMGIAASRRE